MSRTHKVLRVTSIAEFEWEKDVSYTVCEAHYDSPEEKEFEGWTMPMLVGEDLGELRDYLRMMLDAVEATINGKKDILDATSQDVYEAEHPKELCWKDS